MEKISNPSLNIINAEYKSAETSKSTNPFLNTSPVAVSQSQPQQPHTPTTNTTNPFHVSLITNSINDAADHITPVAVNDNFKANDVISICSSDNNNDTNSTLISKINAPKLLATNPFTVAIDEIDNENHNKMDQIQINNNDALNNLKNNNIAVNEKAEKLDEKNRNKKNIEVISLFFFFKERKTKTK